MSLSSLRQSYEQFVLENAQQVTAVESMARNIAFFLPGRVIKSELGAEVVFAGLNLLGIYHDAILAPNFPAASPPSSQTALFNKYTKAAMTRQGYKVLSYTLATLSAGEVVLELLARRRGDKARWDAVLAIEGVKAGLRLMMLNATGGKMVLSPPLPTRDYDTNQVAMPAVALGPPNLADVFGQGNRDMQAIGKWLTQKALTDPSTLRPGDLVGSVEGYRKWCEIAFILRPVVYVMLVRKHGINHNIPFLTSLLIDLTALLVSRNLLQSKRKPTILEKSEYQRRMWLLLWYLLRGPMYQNWTSQKLGGFVGWTKGKMGVGMLGSVIADYLPAWESVYFHTAGTS